MNNPYDTIQRLTDNESSPEEQGTFLQFVDDEAPEYWRDLALSLLEARQIGAALHHLSPTKKETSGPARRPSLLALAAALTLGIGLGLSVMQLSSPRPVEQWAGGTEPSDVAHAVVPTPDPRHNEASLLPIIRELEDLKSSGQWSNHPETSLQAIGQTARARGYEPNVRTAYVTATLSDGRRVIVPFSQLICTNPPNPTPQ